MTFLGLIYVKAFLYTNQLPVDFPFLMSFTVNPVSGAVHKSGGEDARWGGGRVDDMHYASFINVSSKFCIDTLRAVATEVTPCVFSNKLVINGAP